MRRSRTIAKFMVVIAIVAVDLGLLRLFLATGQGLGGLGLLGLAISAAVLGIVFGDGGLRRFAVGFLVAIALSVALFFAFLLVLAPDATNRAFLAYVNGMMRLLPRNWQLAIGRQVKSGDATLAFVTVELAMGLPWIALASLASGLSLALARLVRSPFDRSPNAGPPP